MSFVLFPSNYTHFVNNEKRQCTFRQFYQDLSMHKQDVCGLNTIWECFHLEMWKLFPQLMRKSTQTLLKQNPEDATKTQQRFKKTTKKNKNICFADLLQQTKTQRVDSHECLWLFTTAHQTFKFPGSNFRSSDIAVLCVTLSMRNHMNRGIFYCQHLFLLHKHKEYIHWKAIRKLVLTGCRHRMPSRCIAV